ncbi:MAG TPA: hypothetical protein VMW86_09315 [Dehalococcoidales bacterium]|nr:hypothetical protein [Dehalococcoidales bacterium]
MTTDLQLKPLTSFLKKRLRGLSLETMSTLDDQVRLENAVIVEDDEGNQ